MDFIDFCEENSGRVVPSLYTEACEIVADTVEDRDRIIKQFLRLAKRNNWNAELLLFTPDRGYAYPFKDIIEATNGRISAKIGVENFMQSPEGIELAEYFAKYGNVICEADEDKMGDITVYCYIPAKTVKGVEKALYQTRSLEELVRNATEDLISIKELL